MRAGDQNSDQFHSEENRAFSQDKRAINLSELVEGEDFYREGAAMVFTAGYLQRRGYCCESGCRHCPYNEANRSAVERKSVQQPIDCVNLSPPKGT